MHKKAFILFCVGAGIYILGLNLYISDKVYSFLGNQSVNDFEYFFGLDIMLLFFMLAFKMIFKNAYQKVIINALLLLSLGKVFDEFRVKEPHHIDRYELIWLWGVSIVTLYKTMRVESDKRKN